jgi:hypothetical protein
VSLSKEELEQANFAKQYWQWGWVLRWIQFRDVKYLDPRWKERDKKTWYKKQKNENPQLDLLRELQGGSIQAFKKGDDKIPAVTWAGADPYESHDDLFFRREDVLARWPSEGLAPPVTIARIPELHPASEGKIREEVRQVYASAGDRPPNKKRVAEVVQPRLKEKGYQASLRNIENIAGEKEFDGLRRKPGQRTKK